jgi:precorrin-6A synthase
MRVRVLGVGMGAQHVTAEVAAALAGADYVVAAQKSDDDGLLEARREIARRYGDLPVLVVPDPERDRADPADYAAAVAAWHEARVAAYEEVLAEHLGTAVFMVWGDPALYDSTIRIVERIAARGNIEIEYDVLPGISAPQVLAARHRMVLHSVGEPVHVTTGRRLRDAVHAGESNIVVMLSGSIDLAGLEDWLIWWGANLGAEGEELISGRVGEVLPDIVAARSRAKDVAGWVMDVYLLRRNAQ